MANVLIACEFSGVVRDAFIEYGHSAISCDLEPSETDGPHIQGDIRDVDMSGFDLVISHPPCTYLCNSGVRWLHSDPNRWNLMRKAADFFNLFMDLKVPYVAIENPVMHKYAVAIIGRRQDFIIQPWHFGHGEVKATGFWTKNLPKLKATNIVFGRDARVHKASPGVDRWKERSRTLPGIAEAMAQQWGSYVDAHLKHTK